VRSGEFPCVKKIVCIAQNGPQDSLEIMAVAGAMAAGAFPCVESVSANAFIRNAGLLAFVRALETAPCAATLRTLCLSTDVEDGPSYPALGALIGAGGLPALEELTIDASHMNVAPIVGFLHALGPPSAMADAAPAPVALKSFCFENVTESIGDVVMEAVAAALERGALGSQLEELSLFFFVTDVGLTALILAFQGSARRHLAQLSFFSVCGRGASDAVVDALRAVVVESCPKMEDLHTGHWAGLPAWMN
jgi:hypothetical protein